MNFKNKAAAQEYVDELNRNDWAAALKMADVAIAHDDMDGFLEWQARADAIRAEMDRVEALIPGLPA